MSKYLLYIGKMQDIPKNIKYSLFNASENYLLVYSDSKPDGKFFEMSAEIIKELSSEEKQWLFQCKSEINRLFIEENKKNYIELLSEFATRFEEELERSKERREANGETS